MYEEIHKMVLTGALSFEEACDIVVSKQKITTKSIEFLFFALGYLLEKEGYMKPEEKKMYRERCKKRNLEPIPADSLASALWKYRHFQETVQEPYTASVGYLLSHYLIPILRKSGGDIQKQKEMVRQTECKLEKRSPEEKELGYIPIPVLNSLMGLIRSNDKNFIHNVVSLINRIKDAERDVLSLVEMKKTMHRVFKHLRSIIEIASKKGAPKLIRIFSAANCLVEALRPEGSEPGRNTNIETLAILFVTEMRLWASKLFSDAYFYVDPVSPKLAGRLVIGQRENTGQFPTEDFGICGKEKGEAGTIGCPSRGLEIPAGFREVPGLEVVNASTHISSLLHHVLHYTYSPNARICSMHIRVPDRAAQSGGYTRWNILGTAFRAEVTKVSIVFVERPQGVQESVGLSPRNVLQTNEGSDAAVRTRGEKENPHNLEAAAKPSSGLVVGFLSSTMAKGFLHLQLALFCPVGERILEALGKITQLESLSLKSTVFSETPISGIVPFIQWMYDHQSQLFRSVQCMSLAFPYTKNAFCVLAQVCFARLETLRIDFIPSIESRNPEETSILDLLQRSTFPSLRGIVVYNDTVTFQEYMQINTKLGLVQCKYGQLHCPMGSTYIRQSSYAFKRRENPPLNSGIVFMVRESQAHSWASKKGSPTPRQCLICRAAYRAESTANVVIMPCGAIFHFECVSRAFARKKNLCCPMCKRKVHMSQGLAIGVDTLFSADDLESLKGPRSARRFDAGDALFMLN